MSKELLLNKAIKIAEKGHRKQVDKYGAPYIKHVMRVMEYGKTLDEKIVGVLPRLFLRFSQKTRFF